MVSRAIAIFMTRLLDGQRPVSEWSAGLGADRSAYRATSRLEPHPERPSTLCQKVADSL